MTPQLLHRPQEEEERDQTTNSQHDSEPFITESDLETIQIEVGRELSLPPDASPAETAAIAAAVSAHLSANEAAAVHQAEKSYKSNWSLARRLGAGRQTRMLPQSQHGDAWKLSGRLY